MGIGFHALQLMLHEHRYKAITGDVLTIGRQAVPLSPAVVTGMIQQFGLPIRSGDFEADTVNQHAADLPLITDRSLFAAFSDCRLYSADINDYEGADFIFDICGNVPDDLKGRSNFIIDGGSLDNIFDPFRMLANMSEMLAPGGRSFIFAWSNSFPTAYAKVSPDWLMDYFAVNEYADCKVYPIVFPNLRRRKGEKYLDTTVFHYDPYVNYGGQIGYECSSIFSQQPLQTYCIAEKGEDSTSYRTAVQKHYRGGLNEPYLTSMKRFRASSRPLFRSPTTTKELKIAPIGDYPTLKVVTNWRTTVPREPFIKRLFS